MDRDQHRVGQQGRILAWAPVVLWMAVVFFFSSNSDPPVPTLGNPTLDFVLRKLGHMAEYAILAVLLFRALRQRPNAFLLAFFVASLYAASDEWHQTFVPLRDGNIRDWAIDSVGAVVGLALIATAQRRKDRLGRGERADA